VNPPLSPEIEQVLDHAASIPRGLAFLHRAPIEAVAIALAVDARLVVQVRRLLDDPATHAPVVVAFKAAVARWRREPHPEGFRAPVPPPPAPGPEELLRAAEEHPLGREFFADAPLETVAVVFGVHPFLVLEARGLLEHRGIAHPTE